MRALRTHEPGGPEHLVEEEAPVPAPAMGDVLVRVHAASFTPTELDWPSTWVDRAGRDRRPVIPCHEVSGVVSALGHGTTGVAVGDAVYGLTDWYRDGAAAEYVAVEARNLARKPARLDHRTAAVIPMVALTAQQALFDHGALTRGRTAAVLGAGGGVGTFAVQLARDVDLVLDLVGGEAARRVYASIPPGARVVAAVEPPPVEAGKRGFFFVVEPSRPQLVELGKRIVAGELRPVVGAAWPLSQGRAAFEATQRGRQPGKVVLVVSEEH